jgi:hypothetical protein
VDSIIDRCDGEPCLDYWSQEKYFPNDADGVQDADWDAIGDAITAVSLTRRQYVIKHTSGFCGVNKWMHRWGKRKSPECPRCSDPIEDAPHVWLCRGMESDEVFHTGLTTLSDWMESQSTMPDISDVILRNLRRWRNQAPPLEFSANPLLRDILRRQSASGWKNFYEGTPVKGWSNIQQQHFKSIGSMRSGKRWLQALIQKLWDVSWDLWQYRNDIVHKKDLSIEDKEVNSDIEFEFSLGHQGLRGRALRHFRLGLRSVLRMSLSDRKVWLRTIRVNRNERNDGYHAERRGLQQWLRQAQS